MKRFGGLVVALALIGGFALAAGTGNPFSQLTGDEQLQMLASLPSVSSVSVDSDGVPSFVTGTLGYLGRGSVEGAALGFVRRVGPLYRIDGSEELAAARTMRDELGQVHVKLQQYYRGIEVEGAELYLHADTESGAIHALTGRFFPTAGLPTEPWVGAEDALTDAALEAGILEGRVLDHPRLTYVVQDAKVYLAWTAQVEHVVDGMPIIDQVYADAMGSGLIAARGVTKPALSRKIYNANNKTTLPGTLMFSEGGSSSDQTAMDAYNHAGTWYNYMSTKHGRDSFNGSGAVMTTSVHLGTNYVNAYWNGSQTAFGDGDGSTASSLARDLDVVAHEWTHALTQYTANLAYQNDSGALNEAMSDIFAASVSAWKDGAVSANTWKIGEACWTPATSGDALRYMNNPTQDGSSKDYYPERAYATNCTPSSSNDYCGVHYNSGIGNLAYYLLVAGGTHPRNKTTVNVPAIGIAKAEKIFYRALTYGYMTSSTNYQGARNATAQAATDLYTTTEVNAVHACWDAVGVPGGQVQVTTLSNGQIVSNLSGATGSWAYYKIVVPASQTQLVIKTYNGTGDCDLYVKRGAIPTSSSYDYRPYLSGNNETVTVSNPASGDWYIGLHGYSAYSGMSLQASYTGSSPSFTLSLSPTSLSITKGSSGSSTVTTTVSGGFNSAISLSASGVPSGATASFNPTSIAAPGSGTSTLTINTGTAAAGTYTITVTGSGGGLTKTATLSLRITNPSGGTETEPNNTTGTANNIATSGTQLTGYISSSTDVDYFKVSLPAGKTLTCEMWPPSTKDYDIAFYNSSGTKIASGTNGTGAKETVTYKNTSTSSRTIYIKNYGYNGAYSTSLTYTIKFTW
ncbi:MAG TPA: M4 family metallopeptidase [Thermoanaerobaculaceae bacterium]|nr:M4 family metallopeptidase [Thermoanaerobaculaceae bacterium]HRS17264.1 M4 family metallopeptidase [Thermoanaerobaculaceae bacterium]